MAQRNILTIENDEAALRRKSRKVTAVDDEVCKLLDDMAETMYAAEGVGLAAPQVGVFRRVVVVDIGEGLIELINPVVVYRKGAQIRVEGCLSVPGKSARVKRPKRVIVRAMGRDGKTFEKVAEDWLAVAMCHEIDHLNGKLYIDNAIEFVEVEPKNEEDAQ